MSTLKKKSITVIVSIICLLGLFVFFFANTIVESKLKSALKNLPETVRFNYSALHVNVFQGMLFVENPELELLEGVNNGVKLSIKLEEFKLTDISYLGYIINNTIHLDAVLLRDAEVSYVNVPTKNKDSAVSNSASGNKALKEFNKVVKINNFNLSHASVTLFEGNRDSIVLKSENMNIMFNDIRLDETSAKKSIPFEYSDYKVKTDSLTFNVGEFEIFKLQELDLSKARWVMRKIKLQTRYSKIELSKIITKERDYFDVQVDSIYIEEPKFGFSETVERFYFKTTDIIIQEPQINVYRNKMVADDNTIKPLYSKMLRDLKFDLTVPVVHLNEGTITYEEQVKVDVKPGTISFSDFNANIKNLSNTYVAPEKTELNIHSKFMGSAPLHAIWTFDVQNENDDFMFKTEIGTLPASQLNPFTELNLNIKLEGRFDSVDALINGNVNNSTVNFNVKYENMKVNLLNKERKKNKFLSSIANLFIRNDSDKSSDGFIEITGYVKRDKTKSVFNFLWLNIKEGLKLVLIGDGII